MLEELLHDHFYLPTWMKENKEQLIISMSVKSVEFTNESMEQ